MSTVVAGTQAAWGEGFVMDQRVMEARRVLQDREAAAKARDAVWHKRLLIVQTAIAGYLLVKWSISNGGIFWSTIGAAIVWCVLGLMHLFVPLFTRTESRAVEAAQGELATVTQSSIEAFMDSSALGPYRWVRRQWRVLGVFSDTGRLYYYGPASGYQHLLLDIGQAIQQMTVTNQSTVREHTVSDTSHGARAVYGVTGRLSVIGGGSSKTHSTTTSSVSNAYTLEIQYLMGPTQEPRWLTLPFGEDRQEAENWRLMISRASRQAA
jgi:hypothetical protein